MILTYMVGTLGLFPLLDAVKLASLRAVEVIQQYHEKSGAEGCVWIY